MSIVVQILTLVSKTQSQQGRYGLSFDVSPKKKTKSVIDKRKAEAQVYVDYESIEGGCSPEIELKLKNKQCDIQFSVTGALKPPTPFEEGENVLEFRESLSECRKMIHLVPTYDADSGGTATIKFKVDKRVKHTVFIHNVPTERKPLRHSESWNSSGEFTSLQSTASGTSSQNAYDQSLSLSSTESRSGTERQTSRMSSRSCKSIQSASSTEQMSLDKEPDTVNAGSAYEHVKFSAGEPAEEDLEAKPVPPRSTQSLEDQLSQLTMGVVQVSQGPTVVPATGSTTAVTSPPQAVRVSNVRPNAVPAVGSPTASDGYPTTSPSQHVIAASNPGLQAIPVTVPSTSGQASPKPTSPDDCATGGDADDDFESESAYDRVLCNESLNTLAGALSPSDANKLIIHLGVPNHQHQQNQKNHPGDIVTANYESLLFWRAMKTSSKQEHEAKSKHLFEDLLVELDDIGRKDIQVKVKRALAENRKLGKKDFSKF